MWVRTFTVNLAVRRGPRCGTVLGIQSKRNKPLPQGSGAGATERCSRTMARRCKTLAAASVFARLGQTKLICVPTASGPDQVYRLNGTTGGGGTPTPTPPPGCTNCTDYTWRVAPVRSCPEWTTSALIATIVARTLHFLSRSSLYDQSFQRLSMSAPMVTRPWDRLPTRFRSPARRSEWPAPPTRWDRIGATRPFSLRTDTESLRPQQAARPTGSSISSGGAIYFGSPDELNYEIAIHEDCNPPFEYIYNTINPASTGNDSELVIGVKKDDTTFEQFGCDPTGGEAPAGHLRRGSYGHMRSRRRFTHTDTVRDTRLRAGAVARASSHAGRLVWRGRRFRRHLLLCCRWLFFQPCRPPRRCSIVMIQWPTLGLR